MRCQCGARGGASDTWPLVLMAAAQMQSGDFKVQTLAILSIEGRAQGDPYPPLTNQRPSFWLMTNERRGGASFWAWRIMQSLATIQIWSNNSGDSLPSSPRPGLGTWHVTRHIWECLRNSECIFRLNRQSVSTDVLLWIMNYVLYVLFCIIGNILKYFKIF